MTEQRDIRIHVPVLARVEGEGALELDIDGGEISHLNLRIYEPPRLFERFLVGRSYHEVPDMVARICGICPVAYQMSAVQALEAAFGVDPGDWVRRMRRVFYCGEWLQSHSLHVHLLAAPDFFGYSSAIEMAADYPDEVRRGLYLQGLGNDLIRLLGGRSVHPVGARVGGFHHAPTVAEVKAMVAKLRAALPQAEALAEWVAGLTLPDDRQQFVSVTVRQDTGYPVSGTAGSIISSEGLAIGNADYEQHFEEFQVPHSTALHALHAGKPYLVGPLARLNLCLDRLPEATRALLDRLPVTFPSDNMFHSMLARAIEIHLALVEAISVLADYRVPPRPHVNVQPRAAVGYGASEAPRGLLWHRYETDAQGRIVEARIVPPTSQNQARIEEDIRTSLQVSGLDQADDVLRQRAEMVIRNYDPCISCATHFLKLKVRRGED
jgi:coenzyme F420-reducing hydrogenase alpha subunit